jgi:hypothetical protein
MIITTNWGSSAYKLSLKAGVAFLDIPSYDLSRWKGCFIKLTDHDGRYATGYIGERGTGETYTTVSMTNGNFETGNVGDQPTGWTGSPTAGATPKIYGEERTGGSGTKSGLVTGTSLGYQLLNKTVTSQKCIRISSWSRGLSGATPGSSIGIGDLVWVINSSALASSTWNFRQFYSYCTTEALNHAVWIYRGPSASVSSDHEALYDDITAESVDSPSTSGVWIESSPTGTSHTPLAHPGNMYPVINFGLNVSIYTRRGTGIIFNRPFRR